MGVEEVDVQVQIAKYFGIVSSICFALQYDLLPNSNIFFVYT